MAKPNETLFVSWCDGGDVDSLFASGVMSTILRLPDLKIQFGGISHTIGNQIARQRQDVLKNFIDSKCDWMLSVDSDIVLTPDILDKMWKAADKEKRPVLCGVYFVSLNPNSPLMIPLPCIFTDDGINNTPVHPLPDNEIIPIDVAGFGLMLMHKSVAKKVYDAYDGAFDIEIKRNSHVSEDVSFFRKLKEMQIPVHAHTGARAVHVKRFFFDENYYNLWWNTIGAEMAQKGEPVNFVNNTVQL